MKLHNWSFFTEVTESKETVLSIRWFIAIAIAIIIILFFEESTLVLLTGCKMYN